MLRVILLKGLPACGKSTYAKQQVQEQPGSYKIINKDLLRTMLDVGKYSKSNEQFILKARNALILLALQEKKHVIIDDTNLHDKHYTEIKELVKGLAVVEIKDFTDVPLETCIERDKGRQNYVGEAVIRKMYRDFLKPKPPVLEYDFSLPDAIICDLDGTLALLNGRNAYDASTCENDAINEPIASILLYCCAERTTCRLILVSGRSEEHRPQTERWLQNNGIEYNELYMRKAGDNRKDAEIKQEIYDTYIKGKYNIKFVLDDRSRIVQVWRDNGLTCLQVADGDF